MTKHTMPIAADQSRLWGHVASLPCQWCGAAGPSQVAHSNQSKDGKGMGLKAYPWRVAALCPPCHLLVDSLPTLSKIERREAWDDAHRATIGELFRLGLVRPA
jgi:hypothetical protein